MSQAESSHTPTNEVEEDEAINIDSCSEKSLENIDENAVVIPNEEEVTKKPSKAGRKRKSEVWRWFKTVEVNVKGPKGTMVKVAKAECMQCHKKYGKNSTGSTSHLLKHIETCYEIKRVKGISQSGTLQFQASNQVDYDVVRGSGGYDHMKCREIIAKMIMVHELPFTFVEYHWFNVLMRYNNPLYQKVSRTTIKNDCIKLFESEKEKIKKVFKHAKMISLTSDCWTSNQTIGYMVITAHYIDSNWNMQKRIINFIELTPPHTGEVISDAILDSLRKWGIIDKIGTITLDNAKNNDKVASILMSNFEVTGMLHFNGYFFHVRCCAHILNLIVQDGLGKIENCIIKIREVVKYLRKSPSRLFKFGEQAIQLGINTRRSLCSDVKTRWNSTHRMLQSAIYYKSTLERYAKRDTDFKWLPTELEWANAEKVVKLLDVFTKATNLFSGTSYPTSNLFFNEVFKVKRAICDAYGSTDEFLSTMSQVMFEKFEKYWGEVSLLMTIASILDPRFKMNLIGFCFKKLYQSYEVEARIEEVRSKVELLFQKYEKDYMASNKLPVVSTSNQDGTSLDTPLEDDYFNFVIENQIEENPKTDLEVYLEEKVLVVGQGENFNVLEWWKVNCVKFPILSLFARDILGIPISTVASESAFSAGGRVLDDYRSSLTKDMVELLVCGGDWIRASSTITLHTLQQVAKEEENLEVQIPMEKTD
ncbi:zinc finger BED domain-containing protein RICESLEEPER 2-like [Carex rostrata]